MSYLPAYVYYSYWRQQQDIFIRKISSKYASAIPDSELGLFVDKRWNISNKLDNQFVWLLILFSLL